jgi:hypothetical protein
LRTVFRDTFSARTISLIDLPLTRCSRLIRPTVSTTNIPRHPLASPAGQPAHHCAKGVKIGRRSPLYWGQSSTPKHTAAPPLLVGFQEPETPAPKKPGWKKIEEIAAYATVAAFLFGVCVWAGPKFWPGDPPRDAPRISNDSPPALPLPPYATSKLRIGDVASYQKAASQGDAEAEYALGQLYDLGDPVDQDYPTAISWYTKADERNNVRAQYALGRIYEIVNKDYGLALHFYKKGVNQNNSYSLYALGRLYDYGLGREHDYLQAKKWYDLAIEAGDTDGFPEYALGRLYDQGLGMQSPDPRLAEYWMKIASQKRTDEADNWWVTHHKWWQKELSDEELSHLPLFSDEMTRCPRGLPVTRPDPMQPCSDEYGNVLGQDAGGNQSSSHIYGYEGIYLLRVRKKGTDCLLYDHGVLIPNACGSGTGAGAADFRGIFAWQPKK